MLQQPQQKESPPPSFLPNNFSPAGDVAEAELTTCPPFIAQQRKGAKGARRAGIAYERKAQGYLSSQLPDLYIPGPWVRFRSSHLSPWRYCQPDGFVFDVQSLHITLVEIKLKHTELAWWQLRKLYEPVLRRLFGPEFSYSCCEVVKWFDPHARFPERFRCSPDVHIPQRQEFALHIWGGR